MTVSSTSSRANYVGNGSNTTFPFAFKVNQPADLVVVYTDAAGSDYTLSPSQYAATGFGLDAGGSVTYPLPGGSPIASGTKLTIYRDVAAIQPTSLSNQGAMWPQVIEAALDRLTYIAQKVSDSVSRSLVISPTDSASLNVLPNATQRANGYLGFDGSGQPTVLAAPSGSTPISVAMAGVVNQSTAGLARTAMGAAGLSDNNAFIGASTHSGSETFTNTVDITGGRAKVPTRSGLNDGGTDAASTAYIANLLAAVSGKAIWGLTYANNGSDATNDLDIAAGGCMDGGGTYLMQLASGLTKQSDVAWSVGNNAGGLDTGTVGNNDYYIWLIARSDTGVVDALYSLKSGGADGIPTMPANYDKKRLIGWFKRSGGTIVAFKTYEAAGGGLDFAWSAPTLDINLANTLTTSRRTDSVKVPQNFSVIADLNIQVQDQTVPFKVWIACPDTTDAAPGGAAAPLGNAGEETATAVPRQIRVRTDAAGKIAARADIATVDFYNVSTMGFHWSRR